MIIIRSGAVVVSSLNTEAYLVGDLGLPPNPANPSDGFRLSDHVPLGFCTESMKSAVRSAAATPVRPREPAEAIATVAEATAPAEQQAQAESPAKELPQVKPEPAVPPSLEKGRKQARAKRKAPARRKAKPAPSGRSEDIVTPEELRVLLGEERAESPSKRKSGK